MKIAVLVSGSGTNLQALLDAQLAGDLSPAQIALVISNRPGVPALDRAEAAGVEALVIPHKDFAERIDFERALLDATTQRDIEGIVLAGFMRVLSPTFVRAFPNRIINTHPALCPSFPGMHGAKQAVDYGVKMTGCTVHFVDEGVDTGPIIFQAAVPVLADDTAATLQARIQLREHELLPKAVRALAAGSLHIEDRRVRVEA